MPPVIIHLVTKNSRSAVPPKILHVQAMYSFEVKPCYEKCGFLLIYVFWQLVGFAFLGLGLWLRFSDSTRGIFQVEDFNSSAFVIGQYISYAHLCNFSPKQCMKIYLTLIHISSQICVSLFIFILFISCDCTDCSRLSDADCGGVWRLRCLQWEKMCSASGKTSYFPVEFPVVRLQ